jgi:glycosyltransferase involved in cell wall biosynthesis
MLSPSTKNKTDAIELTVPVKTVDGEPFPAVKEEKKFSIIIPAYNEEKRIKPVLEDIVDYITQNNLDWEIILAIDGNDGTEDLVKHFLPGYNNIRIVKASGRSGKGGSIKRSLNFVKSDFVILMDADNSIPFSTLVMNLHLIDEFDCIIFSRYTASMNEIPPVRRIISRGFNWLLRLSLDLNIRDTQSGYKIIRTKPFKKAMREVSVTNTFFDVAMLYHMSRDNVRIKEIEVHYDHKEGSKFHPLGEVIGQGTSLLAFRIRYSRFYKFVPYELIQLYYRKFRWI